MKSSAASKRRKLKSSGISSNIATGLIVGSFVGLVIIGLFLFYIGNPFAKPGQTSSAPTTTTVAPISLSSIQLFSGSASTTSFSSSCSGDAELVVSMFNNSPNSIHITNVTIYGSSLSRNGSVLLSVQNNSCLTIAESNPTVQPYSSYELDGFLNISLRLGTTCNMFIQFDNGQNFSQTLVAQA